MSFRFRAQDFEDGKCCTHDTIHVAEQANRLLDEHVKTLDSIYAHAPDASSWNADLNTDVGARAKLWDIQEIKPKECKHSLRYIFSNDEAFSDAECSLCGKKFKAKWEECE